ncbi:MAG: hypothetical protein EZS28_026484 [Streblomastix strix]|uniref:U-box domain-containing protein n=1 Tax=Streblomastix strix TaxID=222440 RepID=A0A5J4V6K6_9EUKA|nr:MAG: hypothetical protein EZS28_026484 [Streblomastix strix]
MGRGFNQAPALKSPVVTFPKMKLLTAAEEAAKHYICELSKSIMTDPVSIDGPHYYQRNEIVAYINDQGISPATYEATSIYDIQEEPALKAELECYLRDNPGRLNQNGRKQNQMIPGMYQMGGMPNVPQNQFMPQQNQGQFQQTALQQQQQQFQSPQSPFNPALQSQFNQQGQMGRGFNPDLQLKPYVVTIPKMKLLTAAEEAAKHYICELSKSIMTDPVSMDGHYYQRNEIVAHINDQGISPVTYEARSIYDIQEEPALKAELQRYLRDNPGRLNANKW